MAWVVDVSRCLGLIELENCPSPRSLYSTTTAETSSSPAGSLSYLNISESCSPRISEENPIITSDIVTTMSNPDKIPTPPPPISTDDDVSSVNNSNNSLSSNTPGARDNIAIEKSNVTQPHTASANLFACPKNVPDKTNNTEACSTPRNSHKLRRLASISTPCLQEKLSRFRVHHRRQYLERSVDSSSPVANGNALGCSSLSVSSTNLSNILSHSRLMYAQSCESLSPVQNRRVVLSKDNCTVVYSPVTQFESEHCRPKSDAGAMESPRSSLQYSFQSEDDNALLNRICSGSTGLTTGPPLPAKEHPSRPPKLSSHSCCGKHPADSSSHLIHVLRQRRQKHSPNSSSILRRAVKSAAGAVCDAASDGGGTLSEGDRCWSEHVLAGAGSNNRQLFKQFEEHRTSSMRGPPSRAASAGFLLDTLNLSEVSMGVRDLLLRITNIMIQLN